VRNEETGTVHTTTENGVAAATMPASTVPGHRGGDAARSPTATVIGAGIGVEMAGGAAPKLGMAVPAARSRGVKMAAFRSRGARRVVVATSTRSAVNEPVRWTGNQAGAAVPRQGGKAKATTEPAAPNEDNAVMAQPRYANGRAAEVATTRTRAHCADQAPQQLQPSSVQ